MIAPVATVSVDRCYILWTLAQQALGRGGDFLECGVYQGGTARLLAELASRRQQGPHLHLFDTFTGMPETGATNLHEAGDFADTSLDRVRTFVGHSPIVSYHVGQIPKSFAGLEELRFALAHIDVDIFQSVTDCCEFAYPRLLSGGILIFDDYGFPSCPGARKAVDDFFADKPERPLVLSTGQSVVFRSFPE